MCGFNVGLNFSSLCADIKLVYFTFGMYLCLYIYRGAISQQEKTSCPRCKTSTFTYFEQHEKGWDCPKQPHCLHASVCNNPCSALCIFLVHCTTFHFPTTCHPSRWCVGPCMISPSIYILSLSMCHCVIPTPPPILPTGLFPVMTFLFICSAILQALRHVVDFLPCSSRPLLNNQSVANISTIS